MTRCRFARLAPQPPGIRHRWLPYPGRTPGRVPSSSLLRKACPASAYSFSVVVHSGSGHSPFQPLGIAARRAILSAETSDDGTSPRQQGFGILSASAIVDAGRREAVPAQGAAQDRHPCESRSLQSCRCNSPDRRRAAHHLNVVEGPPPPRPLSRKIDRRRVIFLPQWKRSAPPLVSFTDQPVGLIPRSRLIPDVVDHDHTRPWTSFSGVSPG